MPEGASSEAAAAELHTLAVKAIERNETFYLLDSILAGLARDCPGGAGPEPGKIHAVCSIDRGEGKSTISLALATALAHRGEGDVLLVEADLRSPTLAADLGRWDKPGLEDFLRQRIPLENAIQQTPVDRLRIVTASASQPSAQKFPLRLTADEPAHLLGQPFLRQALEGLRSSYSTIIIDLPALSGGEAIPLIDLLDGVVLVIKAGQTSKERMERAVSLIGREKLVGVVLNNVRHSAPWWLRRILSEDGESA
jgi:Mrp family chromosome partitioning ATPase